MANKSYPNRYFISITIYQMHPPSTAMDNREVLGLESDSATQCHLFIADFLASPKLVEVWEN